MNAPETLSQQDVDSLLQGQPISPRSGSRDDVYPYDFFRPPLISKDRRIIIEAIYARFALSLQSLLSSRLRMPTDATCTVGQGTLSKFMQSVGNPCAAYTFDLGGVVGGVGVLDFSTDVSFFAIDRLFGGLGDGSMPNRALTPLERDVIRLLADRTVADLASAWSDHVVLKPQITGFESSPDTLQIGNPEDNALIANIEVRSGGFYGLVTACLPMMALEVFLGEKTMPGLRSGPQSSAYRERVAEKILGAQVEARVRFPAFRLRAREVAAIQAGQVLRTGHPTDIPIELHINNQRRFLGALGQVRRAVGLRILQAVPTTAAPKASRPTQGRTS